jgi:hypothetical protein
MSGTQSKITELATVISRSITDIDDHLKAQCLDGPSFTNGAPPYIPLPPYLEETRAELLQATSELHDLIMGPLGYLINLTSPTVSPLSST